MFLKKQQKQRKGITLVEMLVYLTIFGMIFVTVIQFMISVSVNNQKAEQRREVEKATSFILGHLGDSFTKSNTIDSGNSIFTNDMGRVRLTNAAVYYQYSITSNRLVFDANGTASYISKPDMVIEKFNVDRINSKSGTPIGIRLTLVVKSAKEVTILKNIQTAFTLK